MLRARTVCHWSNILQHKTAIYAGMCLASGRRQGRDRGLGPFYPQRLSPPRAIGGGLERVSAIGITTVISRCRFALKRCTSCPQPASVACLASGFLLHAARYARSLVSFSGCRRSEEHTSELQYLMRTSYAV